MSRFALLVLALGSVATSSFHAAHAASREPAPSAVTQDALAHEWFGLNEASSFRSADGRCADCNAPRAALWYFEKDLVAVPRHRAIAAAPTTHAAVPEDIAQWVSSEGSGMRLPPFLVWLGAPEVIQGATLAPDTRTLRLTNGKSLAFTLVPKLASNRSYYDDTSTSFFARRPLRLRGLTEKSADGNERFVARVIWPEDFRIDAAKLAPAPLAANESLAALIEAPAPPASVELTSRLLFKRDGVSLQGNHAVLALVLNGAQGDDDEAHAGHFAVATGWHRPDGSWADWLVNNFYNLNIFSEKGIVASMLPMDNYLMDLNSGQSYYRPSYLLVAVLRTDRTASLYQNAIQRVFDRFYRHHLEYDHAKSNCAGLSLDTLVGLGWRPPLLGPTSYAKALLGFFYSSITDMSFGSGRRTFNYMLAERSRLYPRATFETLGGDLLRIATDPARAQTDYEKMLKDDVEAIAFVRIPQIPSSRATGTFPVGSFDDYMARVPKDHKDWKIVPVDSRPFPDTLRDRPPTNAFPSDTLVGILAFGGALLLIVAPIVLLIIRRRRRRHRTA